MGRNFFSDVKIRLLAILARNAPGATTLRPQTSPLAGRGDRDQMSGSAPR